MAIQVVEAQPASVAGDVQVTLAPYFVSSEISPPPDFNAGILDIENAIASLRSGWEESHRYFGGDFGRTITIQDAYQERVLLNAAEVLFQQQFNGNNQVIIPET